MAKAILDASSKNEEEEHIAEQVEPAAVEKHRGKERNDQTAHGCERDNVGNRVARWNDAKVEDQLIQARARRELENKRCSVEEDQRERGNPEHLAADVVADGNGNHAAGILPCDHCRHEKIRSNGARDWIPNPGVSCLDE